MSSNDQKFDGRDIKENIVESNTNEQLESSTNIIRNEEAKIRIEQDAENSSELSNLTEENKSIEMKLTIRDRERNLLNDKEQLDNNDMILDEEKINEEVLLKRRETMYELAPKVEYENLRTETGHSLPNDIKFSSISNQDNNYETGRFKDSEKNKNENMNNESFQNFSDNIKSSNNSEREKIPIENICKNDSLKKSLVIATEDINYDPGSYEKRYKEYMKIKENFKEINKICNDAKEGILKKQNVLNCLQSRIIDYTLSIFLK